MSALVLAFLAGWGFSYLWHVRRARVRFVDGKAPFVEYGDTQVSDLVPAVPGRRRSKSYLVVFDGSLLRVQRCREVPEGVKASGIVYPAGVLHVVELPGQVLYFSALERVVLANQRTMEKARLNVALRALFSGGGDILRYLNIAAVVVPLVIILLLWGQISGVQTSVNRLDATLLTVKEVLSKPLVVDTGEK